MTNSLSSRDEICQVMLDSFDRLRAAEAVLDAIGDEEADTARRKLGAYRDFDQAQATILQMLSILDPGPGFLRRGQGVLK